VNAIPCPWCPRRFLTPAAVRPHLKDIHPEQREDLSHEELRELHAARLKARRKAAKHGSK
jgi:hypothetical protein